MLGAYMRYRKHSLWKCRSFVASLEENFSLKKARFWQNSKFQKALIFTLFKEKFSSGDATKISTFPKWMFLVSYIWDRGLSVFYFVISRQIRWDFKWFEILKRICLDDHQSKKLKRPRSKMRYRFSLCNEPRCTLCQK